MSTLHQTLGPSSLSLLLRLYDMRLKGERITYRELMRKTGYSANGVLSLMKRLQRRGFIRIVKDNKKSRANAVELTHMILIFVPEATKLAA